MRISFAHYGNEKMASYRYRAMIPAREMGATINDPSADVIIFAKPIDQDVPHIIRAQQKGRIVIADFCDMHFHLDHYRMILATANGVTCPTKWFAEYLRTEYGIEASVVPDPFEYPEVLPHCDGDKLLWYGQGMNLESLLRVAPKVASHPLRIVSNVDGAIPWSKETMLTEFLTADIVLMPETAPYKSANRTIEAIRQGCFVVAEPHPAIEEIPGIWKGNIRTGVEWAISNPGEARTRTKIAQDYVRSAFSPATQASAWRTAIQKAQSSSISDAVTCDGIVGSMSIPLKTDGKLTGLSPT